MPTLPYDPSQTALFQPGQRATLFHGGLPASTEALGAEAARLAYIRAEDSAAERARLAHSLAQAGFGAPTLFSHDATGGQGFGALHAGGLALVAFRGTEIDQLRDLLTDAQAALAPWPGVPGQVHQGFGLTAAGLLPPVRQWLAGPAAHRQGLLLCGHSLGAAIATLLALPLAASELVTLGSPMVGDAHFAQAVATALGPRLHRIVNACDGVPSLPSAWLGYGHAGAATYISTEGLRHPPGPRPPGSLAQETAAALAYGLQHALNPANVPLRTLADHAPINHLRALWP